MYPIPNTLGTVLQADEDSQAITRIRPGLTYNRKNALKLFDLDPKKERIVRDVHINQVERRTLLYKRDGNGE